MSLSEFARPDGRVMRGWLSVPPPGTPARGGVVVAHEWWGLNQQIQRVADRLAAEGYLALAPDFFHGALPASQGEAAALMANLDWNDATLQDLRGAVRRLKSEVARVAALGFCMGGRQVLVGLMKLPELDAGVCYYGMPSDDQGDPRTIRKPLQAHFGNQDPIITPGKVDRLEELLRAGNVPYELHRYDATHAFANDTRPDRYHPEAAETAWRRSLTFLARTIGGEHTGT